MKIERIQDLIERADDPGAPWGVFVRQRMGDIAAARAAGWTWRDIAIALMTERGEDPTRWRGRAVSLRYYWQKQQNERRRRAMMKRS